MAAAVGVLAVSAVVAAGTVSAAGRDDDDGRRGGRAAALVGTWDVRLFAGGTAIGRVLATFNADRTTVESAAAPPTTRGASHGVWKRTGRDLFSVTRVFFRFNPATGALLGTQKVNATVRVAPNGDSFQAVSISQQYDPAGNPVGGPMPGTATATRMHVEVIPNQP
jgi:hypothetical protein